MKRIITFLALLIIGVAAFSSCEKMSVKIEFSNMTGKDFYDCQVWFRDTEGGDLIDYEKVGNVLMGESAKVKKLGNYCYIYAKDARGNMVMTKDVKVYNGMKFTKYDLY